MIFGGSPSLFEVKCQPSSSKGDLRCKNFIFFNSISRHWFQSERGKNSTHTLRAALSQSLAGHYRVEEGAYFGLPGI